MNVVLTWVCASTRTSCITSVPLPGPPESTLMNTMYFNGNILRGWVFCCGNKVWNTSAVWIKCQTARGNQPLLYYQLLFQSLCTFSEWTLGHKTLFSPFAISFVFHSLLIGTISTRLWPGEKNVGTILHGHGLQLHFRRPFPVLGLKVQSLQGGNSSNVAKHTAGSAEWLFLWFGIYVGTKLRSRM